MDETDGSEGRPYTLCGYATVLCGKGRPCLLLRRNHDFFSAIVAALLDRA